MLKVLLVDDEPAITEVLAMILSDAAFETRTAGDGLEALVIVAYWMPDIIVTDWHMPRMGGAELLRRLKENSRYRQIPVIAVTATPPEADLPLHATLQKPFFADMLVDLLSEIVR